MVSIEKQEKWLAYLDQKAELKSEMALNSYYVMYDGIGDAEEQQMVAFWRQTIHEYQSHVQKAFGVTVDHLVRKFTLHDRVPCGLPGVMQELAKQGSLATRDEVMNGSLFNKEKAGAAQGGKRAYVASVARAAASGLYRNTFGYIFGASAQTETEDVAVNQEFICVDYLERQSDIFLRNAANTGLTLITMAKAKLSLSQNTQHSLEDIDLLLKHMEHSGRILVEHMTEDASDDSILIKFVQPHESECASITRKEVALFSLQRSIDKTEAKITELMEKSQFETIKIKKLLAQKNKNGAMLALQTKKLYEDEQNKCQGMLT